MKFHVVVEVNGEERNFTVEGDNDIDAQHSVLKDIHKSIIVKTCSPWIVDEDIQES